MLEPIDDDNLGEAIALLVEGFPERSEAFWREGLARAGAFASGDAGWPLGFLLRHKERFAGVLLTFASRARAGAPPQGVVVNLSSWYVQPDLRASAPLMLVRVLERDAALFTDLTPTVQVTGLLQRLGFTQWGEGRVLVSWPQALLAGAGRSAVLPLRDLPADALDPAARRLLDEHERLGCIAAALHDGEAWQPLLFAKRRIRGVPAGYLIHAQSRRQVLVHRRAVTAFLLGRGMAMLCLDADRDERPPGCLFVARPLNKFFRGDLPRDRVDYAYSELVYFDLY